MFKDYYEFMKCRDGINGMPLFDSNIELSHEIYGYCFYNIRDSGYVSYTRDSLEMNMLDVELINIQELVTEHPYGLFNPLLEKSTPAIFTREHRTSQPNYNMAGLILNIFKN